MCQGTRGELMKQRRLIAIGDIHGHHDKLVGLLEQIAPTPEDRLVFLGDYIDRGPDSFLVVEELIKLKGRFPNTVTLRGNHEDYVVAVFLGNINDYERKLWLRDNGGNLTIASYKEEGHFMAVHKDFYLGLPLFFETDDFFFCHAGVRPGTPLSAQRPEDLVNIRDEFLFSNLDFGKVIVHGHSISFEPALLPHRICVDTGASGHGPLTAVELPSRRIWQQL
ncbi:MAG: serine/threonine protein phosphatase [Deltaproteobacteria bacterium]|nr:serine/threonine protein phosphatase [Deltaproteobacteria bacterium]